MTCEENAIVRMPTTTSTSETKMPKLSARMALKLEVLRFQRNASAMPELTSAITPSTPCGIRSSLSRHASASMTTSAPAAVHTIGTMASKLEFNISPSLVRSKVKGQKSGQRCKFQVYVQVYVQAYVPGVSSRCQVQRAGSVPPKPCDLTIHLPLRLWTSLLTLLLTFDI